ncbi:MAG: glutathione peroxidase [Bacteroidales bacterium]|nr:glutathione peroxidase [Bacteroidales bacterium]
MKKTLILLLATVGLMTSCSNKNANKEAQAADTAPAVAANDAFYSMTVKDMMGQDISLESYKGQVVLVVNTATRCGFTPQYTDLENLYADYEAKGFTILDFPCNQFGQQAPGTEAEIHEFCTANYAIKFPQFAKIDVNGENASPLFTYLKEQKGFEGFNADNQLTPRLEEMFDKMNPGWRETSDIKWNFTKFLIDRNGYVVARFEPTHDMKDVEEQVKKLL